VNVGYELQGLSSAAATVAADKVLDIASTSNIFQAYLTTALITEGVGVPNSLAVVAHAVQPKLPFERGIDYRCTCLPGLVANPDGPYECLSSGRLGNGAYDGALNISVHVIDADGIETEATVVDDGDDNQETVRLDVRSEVDEEQTLEQRVEQAAAKTAQVRAAERATEAAGEAKMAVEANGADGGAGLAPTPKGGNGMGGNGMGGNGMGGNGGMGFSNDPGSKLFSVGHQDVFANIVAGQLTVDTSKVAVKRVVTSKMEENSVDVVFVVSDIAIQTASKVQTKMGTIANNPDMFTEALRTAFLKNRLFVPDGFALTQATVSLAPSTFAGAHTGDSLYSMSASMSFSGFQVESVPTPQPPRPSPSPLVSILDSPTPQPLAQPPTPMTAVVPPVAPVPTPTSLILVPLQPTPALPLAQWGAGVGTAPLVSNMVASDGEDGIVSGAGGDAAGDFVAGVVKTNLDDLVSNLFTDATTDGGLTAVDADESLVGEENAVGMAAPAAWHGTTPNALALGGNGGLTGDGTEAGADFVPIDDDWFKVSPTLPPTAPPADADGYFTGDGGGDGDGDGGGGGGGDGEEGVGEDSVDDSAPTVEPKHSSSGDSSGLFGGGGTVSSFGSSGAATKSVTTSQADFLRAQDVSGAQAAGERGWTDAAAGGASGDYDDSDSYCSGVNQFLTMWVLPGSQGYGCKEAFSVAATTFDECSDYCTTSLGTLCVYSKHHLHCVIPPFHLLARYRSTGGPPACSYMDFSEGGECMLSAECAGHEDPAANLARRMDGGSAGIMQRTS
jgi:hypothetical protein